MSGVVSEDDGVLCGNPVEFIPSGVSVLVEFVVAVACAVDRLANWNMISLYIVLCILEHLLNRGHISEGRRGY